MLLALSSLQRISHRFKRGKERLRQCIRFCRQDDKKVAELIGAAEAQYAVECLCAQTEGETEGEAAPA